MCHGSVSRVHDMGTCQQVRVRTACEVRSLFLAGSSAVAVDGSSIASGHVLLCTSWVFADSTRRQRTHGGHCWSAVVGTLILFKEESDLACIYPADRHECGGKVENGGNEAKRSRGSQWQRKAIDIERGNGHKRARATSGIHLGFLLPSPVSHQC